MRMDCALPSALIQFRYSKKSVIDLDFQREFPSKDVKILIFKMSLINSDINKKGESK